MDISTISLYFFSSIAQGYAAIAALLFTAALARINWLDNKLTQEKLGLIHSMHGPSNADFYMAKFQVSELIAQVEISGSTNSKAVASSLQKSLNRIQDFRKNTKKVMIPLLTMMFLGFLGIPFSLLLSKNEVYGFIIIGIFIIGIAWTLFLVGRFIVESISVSLKTDF